VDKFIEISKRFVLTSAGIILLVGSTGLLIFVVIPYANHNSNESDGNYAIEVKTENYKLNQSEKFPIGALRNGINTFLLMNNSNEIIKGEFVLKVKNEECDQIISITSSNNQEKSILPINFGQFTNIGRNININPHSQEFISLDVAQNFYNCKYNSISEKFPISIHGWKILNEID
jgi:hypothetical protein